ncbi:MAG TPA: hypothetical protein VFI73_10690 [Candidatus Nitrosopolaris sp.]|nr:hypothetical protein [Candidatus Nitrosopolaris sp.]
MINDSSYVSKLISNMVLYLKLKKLLPINKRTHIRMKRLEPAENTSLLHNDLADILVEEFNCSEYVGDANKNVVPEWFS